MPTFGVLARLLRVHIVVVWALLLFLTLARPAMATEPLPPTGPLGVVVDKQDNVWTAWAGGIQQFDGQGKLLEEYKDKNKTNYTLSQYSTDLAFGKNGYLYFFASDNIFRLELNSDYKVISANSPPQITEYRRPKLAINPIDNSPLTAYMSKKDEPGGVYRHLATGQVERVTYLTNPTAITTDTAGFIYIADTNQGAVIQFDSNNYQEIQRWRYDDLALSAATEITGVSNLAVDKNGNLYVENGDVYKFDQKGNLLTIFSINNQMPIRAIAADSKSNLYVAHFTNYYGKNNHIAKYDPNGIFLLQWQREEWQSNDCRMICPQDPLAWSVVIVVLIVILLFIIAIPVLPLVLFIRWLLKPKPKHP